MSWPPLEVADIIRAAGDAFIERNRHWLGWKHVKVLLAIARCRTAALGGHLDQCTRCGYRAISFNSCRNRHCPKCQTAARERWTAARQRSRAGFSEWSAQLPCRPEAAGKSQDLRRLATTTVSRKVGGVLEASLRWPRLCAAISRPLHPSRGHLQPSPGLLCQWPSHLSLARFR